MESVNRLQSDCPVSWAGRVRAVERKSAVFESNGKVMLVSAERITRCKAPVI